MVGRHPRRLAFSDVAKRLCHRAKYGRLLQIPSLTYSLLHGWLVKNTSSLFSLLCLNKHGKNMFATAMANVFATQVGNKFLSDTLFQLK